MSMKFDVFFSICQTPVNGYIPSEKQMFVHFFEQLQTADELGFGVGWVAETHLSCQVQKLNPSAVIPQFQGEIGLNTDIFQLAHLGFAKTQRIEIGSAIMNLQANGGPIARAEAVKTFLTLHHLSGRENRRLHLGFAAGRFPFSNRPYGIQARNSVEEAAWPAVKTHIFREATEVFLRALTQREVSSDDIAPQFLTEQDFKDLSRWEVVQRAYNQENSSYQMGQPIPLAARWPFEKLGVIPFDAPLELLNLVVGSHDPVVQELANQFLPCWVFNLSITPEKVIEQTHQRMAQVYHPSGGPWQRDYMPRTALVFLDGTPHLSAQQQSQKAKEQAQLAVENYWKAMEGTLDPAKVQAAVENAIVGNPQEVAEQLQKKYHPQDRLMLWFDFNNHDNEGIKKSMRVFMEKVAPQLA